MGPRRLNMVGKGRAYYYGTAFNAASARVFLAADSPWIFTHLKGMNPQASFSGSTSYSYTPTRSLTLGFDLKF